ncbi:carboxypeptidase regulatory-like domain-containing protein [Streptomyces sp. TG1A-8]|uniref:carboxypeptidase regulatory-like domain-containing protein n=1 Tax=Streptomyces sp. TG1A-8 TaxID=3051385 RepID=UPI00265C35DB|nr:carboxypeptidase regulatory-like domain-containing protein [Streptomyces sp. TG1A-8]MDO0929793.1 carboxypeptidase regulatory-like domain-containing protein [Streptomyces sp. TG1A-8]
MRARLTLVNAEGHQVASHIADRSGSFRLQAPGRGRYLLVAGCAGYFPEALPVVADTPLTTAEVLLVASSSIRGVVEEEGVASPVAGVVVVLVNAQGAVLRSTLTGERGDYAFTGLEAGSYGLAVGHQHRRPLVRTVVVEPHSSSVMHISVQQQLHTVSGTVRDHGGALVVGTPVALADASGLWLTTHTDGVGRYWFASIPSGEYTLRAGRGLRSSGQLDLGADRLDMDLVIDSEPPRVAGA